MGRPKNVWKGDLKKEIELTGFKYKWTAAQDRA